MTEAVRFEDKVVIVTGAGGGLGRAHALLFAQHGAKVVVNDLGGSTHGEGANASAADKVVAEIRAAGGTAVANHDSVTDGGKIVQNALDAFGRIDVVVNNAGILRDKSFVKMEDADWDLVYKVHVEGAYKVTHAAWPHLREQNFGRVIFTASTSGLVGNFGQANYSAAKMGIVGLSKSIALDMSRFNVRSNCIAPFAWTAMTSSIPANTPEEKARVLKLQKMEAGKVAPMVVYLGSDAASEVTGQIFGVRANEIMLFSQPRPVRSVHLSTGWSPEEIAEIAVPAMKNSFFKLERSPDVINWDPI